MIVRQIDANNDWTFGQSLSNYVSANQAVAQTIKTRLQSFLGDCFFAQSDGIDWLNLLGSKNELTLNLAISAVILNSPNVTSLVQLSINLNDSNRLFSLSYAVTTAFTGMTPYYSPTINFLTTEAGDILLTESGLDIEV